MVEGKKGDVCLMELLSRTVARDARVEGLGLASHVSDAAAVAEVVLLVEVLVVIARREAKDADAGKHAEEGDEDEEAEHVGARALLERLGLLLRGVRWRLAAAGKFTHGYGR